MAVLKVEALVPRDPASVSSADACSSRPGRSMAVAPGSWAPSCEEEEYAYNTFKLKVNHVSCDRPLGGGDFEHHQFEKRSIYYVLLLSAVVVKNPTPHDVQYPYI